jgi:hypothetical protein
MNWLKNENIDTFHVQVNEDTDESTSVDRLRQMVTVCKRFTTTKVKKLDKDIDVAGIYPETQLLEMFQKYSLGATVSQLTPAMSSLPAQHRAPTTPSMSSLPAQHAPVHHVKNWSFQEDMGEGVVNDWSKKFTTTSSLMTPLTRLFPS